MSTSDDIDSKIRDLKDIWEGKKTPPPRACPKCAGPMQSQYYRGKVTWVCLHCGKTTYGGPLEGFSRLSNSKKIGKYFLHGLAFSLIILVLAFAWIFATVFLVLFGFLIGLIVALALLVFMIGGINTFVSGLVWGFHMKVSAVSIFLHGLALSLVLLVVGLVTIIPLILLGQGFVYVLLLDIMLCFVYGFVGEKIAEYWIE